MFMFMYVCKSVSRVCHFNGDDCLFFFLFWEVKITKNKNDSIQVFFVCLFASFPLTNLVSAKPKGFSI